MTIKAKKKKKKKTQAIWPIWATLGRKTSGSGVEGAAWHSECWFSAGLCPSINGGASKISRLFFLSLPLSPFLITQRARECSRIKFKKKKLEKERQREVLESSRKRKRSREKKGEDGDRSGYTCVMEKKQEEKKTYG